MHCTFICVCMSKSINIFYFSQCFKIITPDGAALFLGTPLLAMSLSFVATWQCVCRCEAWLQSVAALPRPRKDPARVLFALLEEPAVAMASRSALLERWTGPLLQPGLRVGRRVLVSAELIRAPKAERPAARWFSHPLKSPPFPLFFSNSALATP